MRNRSDTKMNIKAVLGALALTLGLSGWVEPRAALADDIEAPTPAADAADMPETAGATPAKSWVWLRKQGCWGYGYRRPDGLWVIDPGTKRAPTRTVARPAAPSSSTGDPYGFLGWLNSTRAAFGLPAVGYDPSLAGWASANNQQQQARGMGHHVMGPARRQNAAMGSSATVGSQWMASPAHRAALLDPSIRWIGIAGLGAYWTFNAR